MTKKFLPQLLFLSITCSQAIQDVPAIRDALLKKYGVALKSSSDPGKLLWTVDNARILQNTRYVSFTDRATWCQIARDIGILV